MSDETPTPPTEGTQPQDPQLPGGDPAPDWKSRAKATLLRWKSQAAQSSWGKRLQHEIQTFEPAAAVEWASKRFSRSGSSFYWTAGTIALCAYFLADVTSLMVGKYIPEPPPARPSYRSSLTHRKTLDEYNVIFVRNLFNSEGKIPGEETPGGPMTGNNQLVDLSAPPVKTTLPLILVGTVILSDEHQSLATLEDKSINQVYPVREEDEVPAKIKVLKIEPRRVIFVNIASNRKEYVDLPEDLKKSNPRVAVGGGGSRGPTIEQQAPNQYSISRSEVDKTLSDLNNVLTQARAVPNFENGVPSGYKLFQIVPGSIYDKLGLRNGDVIAGLNGSPINDPGKAFEMLSELKTTSHMELQVKRDGRTSNMIYDIH